MQTTVILVSFAALAMIAPMAARVAEPHRHEAGAACGISDSEHGASTRLEGLQIETGDIAGHETFFESVLRAQSVFKIDHPQVDRLRGYCYRDVLIVVRQDLKTPRPTGWVQVNFVVKDVEAVKAELEPLLNVSPAARLRFKPDVPRSNCRVSRLEIYGPEGFMVGFDQVKVDTCERRKEGDVKDQ